MSLSFQIPEIETERLIMRAFRKSDLAPMTAFFADEESRFFGGPMNEVEAWRRTATYAGQWQLHGFGEWALELKENGEFIGLCGPWFPPDLPEPEIAWALLPKFYGKGYAIEAAKRALQHVYRDLGWSTAVSMIDAENTASIRLAERLGAMFERDYREHGWDVQIWRHLPPEQFLENRA